MLHQQVNSCDEGSARGLMRMKIPFQGHELLPAKFRACALIGGIVRLARLSCHSATFLIIVFGTSKRRISMKLKIIIMSNSVYVGIYRRYLNVYSFSSAESDVGCLTVMASIHTIRQ